MVAYSLAQDDSTKVFPLCTLEGNKLCPCGRFLPQSSEHECYVSSLHFLSRTRSKVTIFSPLETESGAPPKPGREAVVDSAIAGG